MAAAGRTGLLRLSNDILRFLGETAGGGDVETARFGEGGERE